MSRSPHGPPSRAVLVGTLVAVAGAVLSLLTGAYLLVQEHRRIEWELDLTGQSLVEAVHSRLRHVATSLTATSAALDRPPLGGEVEAVLGRVGRPAGITALGYVRAEPSSYPVVAWEVLPMGQRRVELPLGLDLATHPVWREAFLAATLTPAADYGPALPLPDSSTLLTVLEPVRVEGSIDGFIVAVVDLVELAEVTLSSEVRQRVEWRLVERSPEALRTVVSAPLQHREYLFFGSRRWEFTLEPAPGSPMLAGLWMPNAVSAAGTALSVALGLVAAAAWRRRELAGQLQQVQAVNQEKDRFLLAVSHELRTPLTAVTGFLQVLTDPALQVPEQERHQLLQLAAEQAEEVASIVQDILVATRADLDAVMLSPRPVDLARELEAVHTGLPSDQRPHLEILVDPELPPAWADPIRVRQILRNLLTNAARYGGPNVVVRCAAAGGGVELSVEDDGPGIPAELRDQVFGPYVRVPRSDPAPASLGLGLFVARTLAELMGGTLSYSYQAGRSAFRLWLPASTALAPAPA